MSTQSPWPLNRVFHGQTADKPAPAYVLYRRLTIILADDEPVDNTVTLLTFKEGQIAAVDLLRELQLAIMDDIEALTAQRERDLNLLGDHMAGRIDGDFEILSPFADGTIQAVDTLYALKLPNGTMCSLYEMQRNLKEQRSEQIEMQIHRGLVHAGVPLPRVRDKGLGF